VWPSVLAGALVEEESVGNTAGLQVEKCRVCKKCDEDRPGQGWGRDAPECGLRPGGVCICAANSAGSFERVVFIPVAIFTQL